MIKFLVYLCILHVNFLNAYPKGLSDPPTASKNVVCYFSSWAVYRNGNGKFDVVDIDPFLCTHINFAFVGLNADASVKIIDPWESNDPNGFHGFEKIVALKNINPNLKILVSMGGWNEDSTIYSQVSASAVKRKRLASKILEFIQEWGFDGFDLDWEFPGQRGGAITDKKHYSALLQDLSDTLRPNGYLLTVAVSGLVDVVDISYDIPSIPESVDMINIMAYDYHSSEYPTYVGHSSPLYASSLDFENGNNVSQNVNSCIDYWLSQGAPAEKINLGVIAYGRTFSLVNPQDNNVYAPARGGGNEGPYSAERGVLGYNEICEYHLSSKYIWDDEQKVPHRVWNNQWAGFEDEKSIGLKAQYALEKKLGGMMFWSLDFDDFRGVCGKKYPLLNAVRNGLLSKLS